MSVLFCAILYEYNSQREESCCGTSEKKRQTQDVIFCFNIMSSLCTSNAKFHAQKLSEIF